MNYFRPVSKSMAQKLKECREKELNGKNEPCTMADMNYAVAPLYKRGLIETRKRIVDNKELMCIYVTKAGIDFLNQMEEKVR